VAGRLGYSSSYNLGRRFSDLRQALREKRQQYVYQQYRQLSNSALCEEPPPTLNAVARRFTEFSVSFLHQPRHHRYCLCRKRQKNTLSNRLPMFDNRFDNSRACHLHQLRIWDAATLDGQPVNLAHLLCGQNLHPLTIIARREKSAKGRKLPCAQSDKLANIMRSLPHRLYLCRFISLPSSPGKAKKVGKNNGSNFNFKNQYRER